MDNSARWFFDRWYDPDLAREMAGFYETAGAEVAFAVPDPGRPDSAGVLYYADGPLDASHAVWP